tara:strand:- start:156 stop:311 length:156 start_codon:yes stop_codon:yes gene_type:complete
MDWSNRFNFGGFLLPTAPSRWPWEVIEKKGGLRGALQICKNLHDSEIVQNW